MFQENDKATLRRLRGDILNALSYLEEAWSDKIPLKSAALEAGERLEEVVKSLTNLAFPGINQRRNP